MFIRKLLTTLFVSHGLFWTATCVIAAEPLTIRPAVLERSPGIQNGLAAQTVQYGRGPGYYGVDSGRGSQPYYGYRGPGPGYYHRYGYGYLGPTFPYGGYYVSPYTGMGYSYPYSYGRSYPYSYGYGLSR